MRSHGNGKYFLDIILYLQDFVSKNFISSFCYYNMNKTSWTSSINTILSGWMALWFNGPSVGEGGPIQTLNRYLFEETREENGVTNLAGSVRVHRRFRIFKRTVPGPNRFGFQSRGEESIDGSLRRRRTESCLRRRIHPSHAHDSKIRLH